MVGPERRNAVVWHPAAGGKVNVDISAAAKPKKAWWDNLRKPAERFIDFRRKHRFETRAAAIGWLLDWALSQKPPPEDQ
jgi:hypothetical protein